MNTNLKLYRLKKGYTQQQLSNETGISRNYISELESNKYLLDGKKIYILSKKLDVCYADLLGCDCPKCKKIRKGK